MEPMKSCEAGADLLIAFGSAAYGTVGFREMATVGEATIRSELH